MESDFTEKNTENKPRPSRFTRASMCCVDFLGCLKSKTEEQDFGKPELSEAGYIPTPSAGIEDIRSDAVSLAVSAPSAGIENTKKEDLPPAIPAPSAGIKDIKGEDLPLIATPSANIENTKSGDLTPGILTPSTNNENIKGDDLLGIMSKPSTDNENTNTEIRVIPTSLNIIVVLVIPTSSADIENIKSNINTPPVMPAPSVDFEARKKYDEAAIDDTLSYVSSNTSIQSLKSDDETDSQYPDVILDSTQADNCISEKALTTDHVKHGDISEKALTTDHVKHGDISDAPDGTKVLKRDDNNGYSNLNSALEPHCEVNENEVNGANPLSLDLESRERYEEPIADDSLSYVQSNTDLQRFIPPLNFEVRLRNGDRSSVEDSLYFASSESNQSLNSADGGDTQLHYRDFTDDADNYCSTKQMDITKGWPITKRWSDSDLSDLMRGSSIRLTRDDAHVTPDKKDYSVWRDVTPSSLVTSVWSKSFTASRDDSSSPRLTTAADASGPSSASEENVEDQTQVRAPAEDKGTSDRCNVCPSRPETNKEPAICAASKEDVGTEPGESVSLLSLVPLDEV